MRTGGRRTYDRPHHSAALAAEFAPHLGRVPRVDGGIAVQVRRTALIPRVLPVERFLELALHLLGGDRPVFAHPVSLAARLPGGAPIPVRPQRRHAEATARIIEGAYGVHQLHIDSTERSAEKLVPCGGFLVAYGAG